MLQKYKNANKLLQTDRLVLNAFPQTEWKDDISFVYNQDFFENGEKKSRKVKYDCASKTKTILEEEDKKSEEKNELNVSPDGKNALYIDNHNLFFKDTKTGKVTQITFDGEDGFEYAIESGCNNSFVGTAIKVGKEPPFALWSPNSRKILTYKVDQRNVEKFHIIRNVMPDEENPRPQLYSYAYHLPNDENVPLIYLSVYDLDTKELKKLDTEPIYFNFNSPLDNYSKKAKWLDNDYIYFVRLNRYFNNAKFNILDVQQNICKTIVEEKSDTFLFYDTFGGADGGDDFNFSAYVFKDRSYAIWKSEENDFAQFLLCNVNSGERNAITSFEYNPMNIVKVDEENSCLYFTANNINISSDPYFIYLCKINLDGSGF
ncbi:MAG: DPP IV N-terminal domain-containing protein, partial [Oscillospiraceae bacterium]